MKKLLLYTLLFIFGNSFSQEEIYFYKDINSSLNFETVKNKQFQILEHKISDGYNQTSYWFKIPKQKSDSDYIFRVENAYIFNVEAFQNEKKLQLLPNERFSTILFSRKYPLIVKVSPKNEAYIPINVLSHKSFHYKERLQTMFIGFYFGFAFLIIISNIFYAIVFKDNTFLYYSLFLSSMSLGLFLSDGILNIVSVSKTTLNILMTLAFIFLAYFSSKFSSSYLNLDSYFPKLKKYSYAIGIIIIITSLIYLITNNFSFLIVVDLLTFFLLTMYWVVSVLLFRKNVFTKIFVFAYVVILYMAIDYYVLQFLGFYSGSLNATHIKIGGFIEMAVLSLAVLFRMKVLKDKNDFMRNEIIDFSREIEQLSSTISKNEVTLKSYETEKLSIRENEIFNLITIGKSNKEIASSLNISVNTVKFHLKNIYEKLKIKNRKEALALSKTLVKKEK